MRKSFEQIRLPVDWQRDPRVIARAVLGVLLLANLTAAYAVFQPFGGSTEELENELVSLGQQVQQRQAAVQRTRVLVAKAEGARAAGDQFLDSYFMGRRMTSSTIVAELNRAAKDAGIRPKGESFVIEPIEGSDTLSMMTIDANYEGTYGDLLQFVNRLDRSPRFLILERLTAAPQQGTGALSVSIKLNTFVREDMEPR